MQKAALPPPFSSACKRLPKEIQGLCTEFLQLHFSIGAALHQALSTGGGVSIQQSVEYITRHLAAIKGELPKDDSANEGSQSWPQRSLLKLKKQASLGVADYTQLMDAWNIFFVRQRYRDERQREAIFSQLAGLPVTLILQIHLKQKPSKELKTLMQQYGQGLGYAELVRRFWYNVHEGRVLIAETELEAHMIDPRVFMERIVPTQLEVLLNEYCSRAQEKMQFAISHLADTEAEPLVPVLTYLYQYELACLAICQKTSFSANQHTVELPFLQRLFIG
ncbi:MAG: squalene/phytoene synthase family protein [Sumerlaeia bacterium]